MPPRSESFDAGPFPDVEKGLRHFTFNDDKKKDTSGKSVNEG